VPPETCPNCGADVPPRAKACPECGADETTGWSEQARHDDLGLPDENFDYEEFVKREFSGKSPALRGRRWFWWLVAAIVLGAFVWLCVR
jgi:zinc-ribbon domain